MNARWLMPLGAAVLVGGLLVAGCAGDDDDDGVTRTLGTQKVNDHGTADVRGSTSVEMQANSFYFGPTFLRGNPGQKITLVMQNESDVVHNITLAGSIDQDIAAGAKASVEVTFPAEGVALFLCKYHVVNGMAGELLVRAAEPQAPAEGQAPAGTTPGGGLGY